MHTSTNAIPRLADKTGNVASEVMSIAQRVRLLTEVDSGVSEINNLMVLLESKSDADKDVVSKALKVVLRAMLDSRNQVAQSVLFHLKLAAAAHIQTAREPSALHHSHRGGLAPWQANLAKRMMLEQMDTNISISCLANACRLSRGHFTRSFKLTVGVPPHRWLQEKRIEAAKELLASDCYVLAEVAMKCGFTDQAHFSRVFKTMTSYTPFSWRRLARPAVHANEYSTVLS